MHITLFSNDCPRCKVLEKKMMQKGIVFSINKNQNDLMAAAAQAGLQSTPIVQVDQQWMDFATANQFINSL